MSRKIPDANDVFTQLDAALCLLARAKGERPASEYFSLVPDMETDVRKLSLDGGIYSIAIIKMGEENE